MLRALSVLVELCRAGRKDLVGMIGRGELTLAQMWTGAAGAARCVAEIAEKGEAALVGEAVAAARIEHGCEMCPSRTEGRISRQIAPDGRAMMVRSWYCGPPLEDRTDAHIKTCGCLVATEEVDAGEGGALVRLAVVPACAAVLKSKTCPQGRW